jgi:predicted amidohydrolase
MKRVGYAQFCPARFDVAANIRQVQALVAGVRADLLVLPELANSGYMYTSPQELAPFSEPGDGSGAFLGALRELAAGMGGVIVTGFSEKAAEGLYNSAAAVSGAGVITVYRKTHLFLNEKDLFLPGNSGFGVFEHEGLRVGMMICFDWFFPESARTLALRGAQVIAHPANLVLPYCQTAMVTRSLENAVFSVTTNRYGAETLGAESLTFTGASQVMDTRGRRLAQAPVAGDDMQVVEINPAEADDKQVNLRNHRFNDRRPELYG